MKNSVISNTYQKMYKLIGLVFSNLVVLKIRFWVFILKNPGIIACRLLDLHVLDFIPLLDLWTAIIGFDCSQLTRKNVQRMMLMLSLWHRSHNCRLHTRNKPLFYPKKIKNKRQPWIWYIIKVLLHKWIPVSVR